MHTYIHTYIAPKGAPTDEVLFVLQTLVFLGSFLFQFVEPVLPSLLRDLAHCLKS